MKQTTSQKAKAATSLNQVPSLHKKMAGRLGPVNLDWGGGKFDTATEYLAGKGVENLVFDPYNRSEAHNDEVWYRALNTPIHSITVANVLNVLKSKAVRTKLLKDIRTVVEIQFKEHNRYVRVYFTMYEKKGTGVPDATLPQTNMKTEDYRPEIAKAFGLTFSQQVEMKNKVLIMWSRSMYATGHQIQTLAL